MNKTDENYIAIPKSEYEYLLHCKQELIRLRENDIQNARLEMQINNLQSIVLSSIRK